MNTASRKPLLGISACLLGQHVRYDGVRLDPWLGTELGRLCGLVPVCPEVEMGLPAPREPVRLLAAATPPPLAAPHPVCPPIAEKSVSGSIRLVTVRSAADLTGSFNEWARERLAGLAGAGLAGFVFKSRSPTCGPEAPVFDAGGGVIASRPGLWAAAFMAAHPELPVADEEQLSGERRRIRFVRSLFSPNGQAFPGRRGSS